MAKRPGDPFRRSDLFVVRIWRTGHGNPADEIAGGDGPAGWQGKVQRAVSGETQHFQGWNGLIGVLEGMLAATRPTKETGAQGDGGDRQSDGARHSE